MATGIFKISKERQKVNDYIDKGCITGDVIPEFNNKPYLIKKYGIDEKNLKEIFIVWHNYEEEYPYIIKCPVKSVDSRSYIINIKDRSRLGKREYYNELKIPKKEINKNFHYKAASTYELAFSFLLIQERNCILNKLKETKDLKLHRLFIEATNFDLLLGLEMLAREFKMDYLFRLDDDTKLEKEN